jgi:hypothetical protein
MIIPTTTPGPNLSLESYSSLYRISPPNPAGIAVSFAIENKDKTSL